MSFSLTIVYVSFWIIFIGGADVICHSSVDPVQFKFSCIYFTMETNLDFFFLKIQSAGENVTVSCQVQGVLLVYGFLATILWFTVMSLNVFQVLARFGYNFLLLSPFSFLLSPFSFPLSPFPFPIKNQKSKIKFR